MALKEPAGGRAYWRFLMSTVVLHLFMGILALGCTQTALVLYGRPGAGVWSLIAAAVAVLAGIPAVFLYREIIRLAAELESAWEDTRWRSIMGGLLVVLYGLLLIAGSMVMGVVPMEQYGISVVQRTFLLFFLFGTLLLIYGMWVTRAAINREV